MGDATKELGPFYSVSYKYSSNQTRYVSSYFAGHSYFVDSDVPWFIRGGHFTSGSEAGVGAFNYANGHADDNGSFRLVLMP